MDCPSEENIIRMKLAELGDDIASLDFDLRRRTLAVTHSESAAERLADAMESVDMGAKIIETRDADAADRPSADTSQRRVLYRVLLVNAVFFALEMVIGLLSRSMGLVADSLDMLADATVYGMSLMVVGAAVGRKKRVAWWSGILQTLLAVAGMVEVVRRFVSPSLPPRQRHLLGQRRGGQPRSHSFGRGGLDIQQPCARPCRRSRGVRHRPAWRRPYLQTFTLRTVAQ